MAYEKREDGWHPVEEERVMASATVPLVTIPATELPPLDPKLVKAEAERDEARRIAQQLQTQLGRQQQTPPPSGQPNLEDMNKQFYKDPVSSTVAIVQQGIADALRTHGSAGVETLIQVAKDKVRAKNPELFDKYADEIELRVKTTTDPQYHSNINVWESSANISYGEHMSEIREAARANQPTAPAIKISNGGPAAPGGHQPEAPKGAASKLSAEEITMAKNLRVDPELYAKGKLDYENQNTRGKSSWDPYITFDSRDKARDARVRRKSAAAAK